MFIIRAGDTNSCGFGSASCMDPNPQTPHNHSPSATPSNSTTTKAVSTENSGPPFDVTRFKFIGVITVAAFIFFALSVWSVRRLLNKRRERKWNLGQKKEGQTSDMTKAVILEIDNKWASVSQVTRPVRALDTVAMDDSDLGYTKALKSIRNPLRDDRQHEHIYPELQIR